MRVNCIFLTDFANILDFWSHDFFINELISKDFKVYVTYLNFNDAKKYKGPCDILCYYCRTPENYPWAFVPSYEQVLEVVKNLKPKIIVQTGDEHWYEDLQQHNDFGNYCKLFLRQHNHYNYSYTKNTIHIPLGYVNNFDLKEKKIIPIKDRKYNWCYIGDLKNNIRKHMLDTFLKLENNFIYAYGGIYETKPECSHNQWLERPAVIDTYLNTIFAPHPQGWTTIDGMRLYEASICGAIPVVVGTHDEISLKFYYEEMPPWIFENSWEEAFTTCTTLLNNKDYLQILQNKILKWWKNRIVKIQNKVSHVLQNELI
jgi:hypothetical protein